MVDDHDWPMARRAPRPGARRPGPRATVLISVLSLAACTSPATTATTTRLAAAYAVPALREPLTTDAASPVAHDTETDALVEHDGRLYATTDQLGVPRAVPSR